MGGGVTPLKIIFQKFGKLAPHLACWWETPMAIPQILDIPGSKSQLLMNKTYNKSASQITDVGKYRFR